MSNISGKLFVLFFIFETTNFLYKNTTTKWLLGITAWLIIAYSYKNFKVTIKNVIVTTGPIAKIILIIFSLLSINALFRGFFKSERGVLTYLGNPETALSVLTMSVFLNYYKYNNYEALSYLAGQINKLYILTLLGFTNIIGFVYPLQLVYYKIPTIRLNNLSFIPYMATIFGFTVVGARVGIIRLLLLTFLIVLCRKNNKKVYFILFIILIAYILYFLINGEDVDFAEALKYFTDKLDYSYLASLTEKTDTRSFLYSEVFRELSRSNELLLGRGAEGGYYSEYFANSNIYEGDDANRLGVEVGYLSLMLKVGYLGTITYILINLYAIYMAFFKSQNSLSRIMGLYVYTYLVLFFLENIYQFSFFTIINWVMIGLLFSSKFIGNKSIVNHSFLNSK